MASQFTLGIIVGGLISIANFYWLKHDLYKIFQRLTDRVKSRVMFKYYIRLTVTAVVLYFIIRSHMLHVIGLLIGLSTVIINIVITTLILLTKKIPLRRLSNLCMPYRF